MSEFLSFFEELSPIYRCGRNFVLTIATPISFFLVTVTIEATIPLSRPGELGGGTCFLGLVALLLNGNLFFRLDLDPAGGDIFARVSI